MKNIYSKICYAIFVTSLMTTSAYAAGGEKVDLGIPIPVAGGTAERTVDYVDYIKNIYNFSLRIGVLLTVLMLIYAGYRYMTSQGNPSAINEAKDILIGSLSGFAFLMLVFAIMRILGLRT